MSARRRPLALILLAVLAGACSDGTTGVGIGDSSPTATATGTTTSPSADASPSAPASTSPSTPARPGSTATPTGTMNLRVYYLHDTGRGPRLQSELRRVARTTGVVRAAVDAVLHLAPLDPDYRSLWPRATAIRGVSVSGDVATVDLSGAVRRASAGGEAESMSIQQMVWTVTAAAPSVRRVRLYVDGRPTETLWGHADTRAPIGREPHGNVLAAVSIDQPLQGSRVSRTFTFRGTSNTFEANVVWRVSSACPPDTTCTHRPVVYRQGHTTASAGTGTRGTWQVTVTLPDSVFETAGYIEIRAFESSAMDGSEQSPDTKVVKAVAS